MKKGTLYISYDGVLEPLGQSQVLAYLRQLVAHHSIHLISFEKPDDWTNVVERERIAHEIAATGIVWHPLKYHKHPSAVATAWDIVCGTVLGLWLVLRYRLHVVHARSYVASVMALALKKLTGRKFIFDMRGFWVDERVDGGIWPAGSRLYRVAKWFERQFLLNADVVVSLTYAAVNDIRSFPYMRGVEKKFVVIPTCVNLQLFHPLAISTQKHSDEFVLGYVGSAGTWYLFDEVLRTFNALLKVKPRARMLIINRNEHAYIRERMAALGVDASKVELKSASHDKVAQEIHRMDVGVFYIRPAFSKRASAPTKFGEFLGCGVPCISNYGVGDTESILEGEDVGVSLRAFDDEAHAQGLQKLLNLVANTDTKSRCVGVANKYFSLEQGIKAYRKIYQELC